MQQDWRFHFRRAAGAVNNRPTAVRSQIIHSPRTAWLKAADDVIIERRKRETTSGVAGELDPRGLSLFNWWTDISRMSASSPGEMMPFISRNRNAMVALEKLRPLCWWEY